MAENKTEEEILETDTVNEEASSAEEETKEAVSYTHLTLPTTSRV